METRDRIAKAALKLFAAEGYARTSIGAIEKAAGLAPRAGAFYRHFKSKEELLMELVRSQISETPDEFDFQRLKDLGDTRAELILIAQTYESAARRQMPFLRLIEEVRHTEWGADAENRINQDMLRALEDWVAQKTAAHGLKPKELTALTVSVFGGWLFYIAKFQQGVRLEAIDRDTLLARWAAFWAAILDGEGAGRWNG